MKEITLSEGAVLKIGPAPFEASKNLFQALLDEAKAVKLDPTAEVDVNLYKDLFCIGLSSKKIESALKPCLEKCLYNGLKIDASTFEDVKAREHYLDICFEVTKENVAPFTKTLMQKYSQIFQMINTAHA